MKYHFNRRNQGAMRGFSLMELLIVMVMIGIAAVLTLPSLLGTLDANRITQSGEIVAGAFSLARQSAISRNREVEVRLITSSTSGSINDFCAVQLLARQDDNTWKPITKAKPFPAGIIPWAKTDESTLMNLTETQAQTTDPRVGTAGLNYSYRAFRYYADGSTDLGTLLASQTNYFLTLVPGKQAGKGALPANYLTVSVQPLTGAVTVWRP